ncbi:MAG: thiamine pyrophosphate-dependent enzyme [Thermoplasmata archaeon]
MDGSRAENSYLEAPGGRALLLGNEAIARGLLEAGVDACTGYPGTPSTEILEMLIKARHLGHYVEWSTNEKVAAEVAISASLCGLRASVSMKGVGVNVASEPIQAFTYIGAPGGFVLITADDPSMNSSHNEQDNRIFARQAYLPVIEPCGVAEAKEAARLALLLSERWHQPVMLRSTTAISHSSAPVKLGPLPQRPRRGTFTRAPERWTNLPQNARRMRWELLERMARISLDVENIELNSLSGRGELGFIASGAAHPVLLEALEELELARDVRVLKLSTPYPLPERMVSSLLDSCERVLVVEELEPFVEEQVGAIAHRMGSETRVEGKRVAPEPQHRARPGAGGRAPLRGHGAVLASHLPIQGELTVTQVVRGIRSFLGMEAPARPALCAGAVEVPSGRSGIEGTPRGPASAPSIPPRPPVLCAGCLHRNAFFALNIVERRLGGGKRLLRPSDIGCYTLGYQPPLNAVDSNFCMGAGVGIGSGLGRFSGESVVAQLGDSTFFHSGIPAIINSVMNGSDLVVLLLDNGTTAMTGHQPHPGTGRRAGGEATRAVSIERVLRACGVAGVSVVPGWSISRIARSVERAVMDGGVRAVVVREPCALLVQRERRKKGRRAPVCRVDAERCKGCLLCITRFGCPAMKPSQTGKKMEIDPGICSGCGACLDKSVCPHGAIQGVRGGLAL